MGLTKILPGFSKGVQGQERGLEKKVIRVYEGIECF